MADRRTRKAPSVDRSLLDFLCDVLRRSGFELLHVDGRAGGRFLLSFEDHLHRRFGVNGYLVPMRPGRDRDGASALLELPARSGSEPPLKDPFGLFTSVLLGVDPTRGLFVAFDPARHFPEDEPLRVPISAGVVRVTQERGWHSWLREGWERRDGDFAEALVGFRREQLLAYLEFERIAVGLDTGHRSLLADAFLDVTRRRPLRRDDLNARLHSQEAAARRAP